MIKYIVQFNYSRCNMPTYKIIECTNKKTWRELQQLFDPKYQYDNLKFFVLGDEIPFIKGE